MQTFERAKRAEDGVEAPAERHGRFPDGGALLRVLVILLPVLVMAWIGWQHRWTADDGFINFRIVRNIREGHGPVYNIGDRVESGTSSLWIAILVIADLLTPLRIELIAMFGGLGATLAGLTFGIFGTKRALMLTGAPAGTLVPLGALIYVALPPAWDFSTSGLETGLGILWLGACWWLLVRVVDRAEHGDRWRPWWVPVVLGLGPLVRPDFTLFSVAFLVALMLVSHRNLRSTVAMFALAIALPVVDELFRMAYYGAVVPNTAIVKEAGLSRWGQGWLYVKDFFGPYLLILPIVLVLGVFLSRLLRRGAGDGRRLQIITGLTVIAGVAHGIYVTRIGGDFMHGRMLLPSLFAVLLPLSVVVVRSWQWLAAAALVIWAIVCGSSLRTGYSGAHPANPAIDYGAVNLKTGIGDERLYYLRLSDVSHPVTIDDYLEHSPWALAGARTREDAAVGDRGLLMDAIYDQTTLIPLRSDIHAKVVAYSNVLGIFSYAAGDQVYVVDEFGLADAVPAHARLVGRGRPGHEKFVPPAWVFARFASPDAPIPSYLSPADVAAARHALTCGDLAELQRATTSKLDLSQMITNVRDSLRLSGFRYAPSPVDAELELCGG
jgi:arabinofuranosyltransferase